MGESVDEGWRGAPTRIKMSISVPGPESPASLQAGCIGQGDATRCKRQLREWGQLQSASWTTHLETIRYRSILMRVKIGHGRYRISLTDSPLQKGVAQAWQVGKNTALCHTRHPGEHLNGVSNGQWSFHTNLTRMIIPRGLSLVQFLCTLEPQR